MTSPRHRYWSNTVAAAACLILGGLTLAALTMATLELWVIVPMRLLAGGR